MGRVCIVLGAVFTIVGIAGMVFGIAGPVRSAIGTATTAPDATTYCRAGEKIAETRGASSYRPGQGSSHNVNYFCVDAAGTRRDVTEAVMKDLVEDTVSGVGTSITVAILMSGVIVLGSILLMLGIVLVVRRRVLDARGG